MRIESMPSFNRIHVPHIDQFIDMTENTYEQLRKYVFSLSTPAVRVCSLGVLLRNFGLTRGIVDCAACLLVSEVAELRGSAMATVFTAINHPMTFEDRSDVDLLIQISRHEPLSWLKPWALALRYALSDDTVRDDALKFLTPDNMEDSSDENTGVLHRALSSMARRIIENSNVQMFVF